MEPRGPFHLGIKESVLEDTSEYIHSDTIFSAICNVYRLLYGRKSLEEILKLFKDHDPPFLISSAFPYISDTLLFPMPKSIDLSKYSEDIKKFKKVGFVSKSIFERIIKGKSIEEDIKEENLGQNGYVLFANEEKSQFRKGNIWEKREVPRVVIDRKTSASNIYHFGEIVYSKDCGLYFLIEFKDRGYEGKLKAAIRLLGDEGIGGDRTYGKGLFKIKEPEFNKISIDLTPKEHFITLSLYYPRKEELTSLREGFYELIGRGGWIYSPQGKTMRRKFVRMFAEGSVFPAPIQGDLVSVKPKEFTDHEIYRYGYAFAIPLEVEV
jgi:CRISPR-associated protein Csm4